MTEQEHKERHQLLHKGLDELFADYITYHPEQVEFLKMPIKDLIEWSYKQTIKPNEEKDESTCNKRKSQASCMG